MVMKIKKDEILGIKNFIGGFFKPVKNDIRNLQIIDKIIILKSGELENGGVFNQKILKKLEKKGLIRFGITMWYLTEPGKSLICGQNGNKFSN